MPPEAMLGFDTADDAAVWRIAPNIAGILTIDFLTPIVDEPYDFGRIAAANALSDVFAMGGVPNVALNVVAMDSTLPEYVPRDMLRGGLEKVIEAGAVIMGGHSIDDEEPKYGLCVTGYVHPDKALRNVGARPGDALVLTKPLGTGVLTTAAKADLLEPEQYDRLVHSMARLNAHAAEAVSKCPEIHACTDVTGFGLLGHADEMARGSGVTIRLYSRRLPLLPGALEFAEMGIIPAGAYRNLDYVKPRLTVAESVQQARVDLISDPQTSGGLLVALPMEDAGALLAALRERDPDSAIIGAVVAQTEHTLEIV